MALATIGSQDMVISTAELETLETKVRSGLASFVEVGNALMEIRDRGGYKRRGYKTFEEYCSKEFGASDRHARRLIAGAETAAKVQAATGQAPRNDGVARELTGIANDPALLQKVEKKLESYKKPLSIATATAEKVKEVVAAVTGKTLPEKPSAAPKPGAARQAAPGAPPAASAGDVATLQATMTKARSFLSNHPWFKGDESAKSLVGDLDKGLALLDQLLAATYSRPAGPKPAKAADAGGPPKCPSCKQPIQPGDPFCGNCGAAL